MQLIVFVAVNTIALAAGAAIGYYVRQSIVKKRKGTIEAKLQKKVIQTRQETEEMVAKAKQESHDLIAEAQKEREERRKELLKTEQVLLKREQILDTKISAFEEKESDFESKLAKLKEAKERIIQMKDEVQKRLESVSQLSEKQARELLLSGVEDKCQAELMERVQKLKQEGEERFKTLAKEILISVIQKYALNQAQEITTTTINIPSDEVKGRIIGKEGRNIKTFEKMAGVDVIVDETPETVIISGFNPLRRQIAKLALERLIKDGRIQPARIEEVVNQAKEDIEDQVQEYGEKAVLDAAVLGLPAKIVQLLGRLHFRTSYGQNVLSHSIEVAHLAAALAEELGLDAKLARKAGLLHDIGKAVDHQIQGSHVDIGIKILEKFRQEPEVIAAMKSHHEEYVPESMEAVLVKVADQISGARPGARKDTVENYILRLKELEDLALGFSGVATAYAVQAGREIRVFVKPEEVGDLEAYKMARDIADKIQRELNYPGEIRVNVIRETRVIEYAR
ncbi:MAG: ribonuclease Y [Candidatus Pacebacteria bacterium]|nr:ribonuclease Y [Candidatus Paceibacterota bacterium]